MPRPSASFFVVLALAVASWIPAPAAATGDAPPQVAIIVGPVGELTPTYVALAERAATAAASQGAAVTRAYSPNAKPEQVLAAVEGANIIVYFGHGTGFPNPYAATLNPETVNGWGLQGPRARGTHEDSYADGTLAYYGEAWIARHARPAPGFVMIYSNVCYAPGASEPGHASPTPKEASSRAGGYARTPLAMGASAVFATDFYAGAAELVGQLLSSPTLSYGDIVRSGAHYVPLAVSIEPHPYSGGSELWLQRSAYFGGQIDYWFAFSGDPTASLTSGGSGRLDRLLAAATGALTLQLLPGAHLGIRLDEAGGFANGERWTSDEMTELVVDERRTLADQEGIWFRIAEGPHAGAWIAESAQVHLRGVALEAPLEPARVVELSAGTHAGHRFEPDGSVAASRIASLDSATRSTADALAVVNGQLHVRLADGAWAGHWLLVSDAVRVTGPVPLPAAESVAEPSPVNLQPSASPTATPGSSPSAAASAAPTAAAGTPTPSPMAPAPSATPEPSSSPSPSPSTASPAPSDATPAASVLPSPSPAAVTPSPSPAPDASPAGEATFSPSPSPP